MIAANCDKERAYGSCGEIYKYGGIDVLHVVEVDRPVPGPEQVRVRINGSGINPGEAAIRRGLRQAVACDISLGTGSDPAGSSKQSALAVKNVAVGDEVIGFSNDRSSQAELVNPPISKRKP